MKTKNKKLVFLFEDMGEVCLGRHSWPTAPPPLGPLPGSLYPVLRLPVSSRGKPGSFLLSRPCPRFLLDSFQRSVPTYSPPSIKDPLKHRLFKRPFPVSSCSVPFALLLSSVLGKLLSFFNLFVTNTTLGTQVHSFSSSAFFPGM